MSEEIEWVSEGYTDAYFDRAWSATDFSKYRDFVVLRVGGEFFVSPRHIRGNEQDIGPYATLEEAKAVAIATMRLNQ